MLAFDAHAPNAARIYDCLLGGKDNFHVDRVAAGRLLRIAPDARTAARDNRMFLGRAVAFLAGPAGEGGAGVSQFLDIGSGFPGLGNVHEVAQRVNPSARVVYADYDPVVVGHAQTRLAGTRPAVAAVLGDLGDPEGITGHHVVQELIDFGRPVAVTLVAVLHFLEDRAAYAAVEYLTGQLMPGSYVVISHVTSDGDRDGDAGQVSGLYQQVSARLHPRPFDAVIDFFDGTELVPPGVVPAGEWRGETDAVRVVSYAGVGRKVR